MQCQVGSTFQIIKFTAPCDTLEMYVCERKNFYFEDIATNKAFKVAHIGAKITACGIYYKDESKVNSEFCSCLHFKHVQK